MLEQNYLFVLSDWSDYDLFTIETLFQVKFVLSENAFLVQLEGSQFLFEWGTIITSDSWHF